MRSPWSHFAFVMLLALSASGTAWAAGQDASPDKLIQFAGEVARGKEFRHPIGHGLVFVLVPDTSYPGVISGWTIAISQAKPVGNPDCRDFAWVVMPPYRGWNPLYLSNSYSWTARQAVEMSPRNFNFVLNCADCQVEAARVRTLLWRGNESDKEYNDTLAKLGSSPQGHGKLWIDESRTSPGMRVIEEVNYGSIDWIRFHVEIRFP